ncbi:MAG: hypothetical protein AAFV95_03385 [Bacteroidota bacterium]
MKRNILRQLKDIQFQAEKLLKGSPDLSAIRTFSQYSAEINRFLLEEIDLPDVHQLVYQIPPIPYEVGINKRSLFMTVLPSVLWYWYYERQIVEEAQEGIQIARGKYSSIEFMLKNYLA